MKIVYADFNNEFTNASVGMYMLQPRNTITGNGKVGWKKIRANKNGLIPNYFMGFSCKNEAIENVKKWAKRTPKNDGTVYVEWIKQEKTLNKYSCSHKYEYKYELCMYWSEFNLDPLYPAPISGFPNTINNDLCEYCKEV